MVLNYMKRHSKFTMDTSLKKVRWSESRDSTLRGGMEKRNDNLQIPQPCNFNYQLSGLPSSLSLTSEPPDVRNWFSSYAYESPALGSDESFMVASSLEKRNCQNHSFCSEARHIEEIERPMSFGVELKIELDDSSKIMDLNLSAEDEIKEVPDSLESETQLSEPPDVRNLLTCYIYESPELGIDFREETKDIRCDGNSFSDDKRKIETAFGDCRNADYTAERLNCDEHVVSPKNSLAKEQHEDQYPRKIAHSLESPSQLSEAPHISNWFSSYVYESPELSLGESFLMEKDPLREVFVIQKSSGNKRGNFSCHSSPKVGETELEKTIPSKQATHLPCQEQDELKKWDLSAQDVPTFDLLSMEVSGSREEMECTRFPQPNLEGSSSNKNESTQDKLTQTSTEEPNNTALHVVDSVISPVRSMISRGLDAENERVDTNSNGFVSIKSKVRRRVNHENDPRRPLSSLKECSSLKATASCAAAEDSTKGRPLSDITNIQDISNVLAYSGKWKCPRKSKKVLGPPMKQLRLEKWVHLIRK
ncbi:hypothetical protein SAY87_015052 [Trapa incisa]|uniref:Uncharacterized protein n=1 Tax=Trapa incisa TaxID=236973 RepID=A0AAN7GL17_9MYRT|nr:hypothetical protein SAY87_015052 [Trapa incisa]